MKRTIIDMHTHCFPDRLAQRALTSPALKWNFSGNGSVECERQLMKKFGISHSVMLSVSNRPDTQADVNAFALATNSRDMIAFGSVHPFSADAVETVERLFAAGVKGVKFHNSHQRFDIADDRCRPLYKRIGQLGMITVIHGGKSRKRAEHWAWPSEVAKVIGCFGGAPFICAHMGGMNITEAEFRILRDLPVYVDTAMVSAWLSPEELAACVETLGSQRVLFGSDLPWGRIDREIALVAEAPLSEEEKQQIFYRNAAKLLALNP